jgi:integrase
VAPASAGADAHADHESAAGPGDERRQPPEEKAVERAGTSPAGRIYGSDPTKPIGRWKEAWESAKIRAGVSCRFHDLRHTGCTRMLEAGIPFSVVATVMGWSPSTTVRMSRRYGHIGQSSQRQAVNALDAAGFQDEKAQTWMNSQKRPVRQLAN